MKLSVVRGGGIGGFVKTTEVTDDALPAEEAQQLKEKVEQAGVLRMADAPDPKQSVPDELQYEFVVEDEGRLHKVSLSESALTDDLRSLLAWADSSPHKKQRIEPPGGA